MVFDAYFSASPKAKVLNLTFFVFNLLAWICCCVSFGGKLIHATLQGNMTLNKKHEFDFYWNHVHVGYNNENIYFDKDSAWCKENDFCESCEKGGRGLIALQVFAFIGLTAVLLMTVIRMLGSAVSFLEPTRKSLLLEFGVTALNVFWFFLAVCIYGGTCFTSLRHQDEVTVVGTGFGFLVACFFFLLINLLVGWTLRNDASTHLGSGAGGASSDYQRETGSDGADQTTNYNPNAATYQYNAADAQSYAGQYNGDVVPAGAPSDSNI